MYTWNGAPVVVPPIGHDEGYLYDGKSWRYWDHATYSGTWDLQEDQPYSLEWLNRFRNLYPYFNEASPDSYVGPELFNSP